MTAPDSSQDTPDEAKGQDPFGESTLRDGAEDVQPEESDAPPAKNLG